MTEHNVLIPYKLGKIKMPHLITKLQKMPQMIKKMPQIITKKKKVPHVLVYSGQCGT